MEYRRQEGILNVLNMVEDNTAIVSHVPWSHDTSSDMVRIAIISNVLTIKIYQGYRKYKN